MTTSHLALRGLLVLLAGLPLASLAGEPLIVVEDRGGASALPYYEALNLQPRANAPLDDLAKLIGFPGKLGMDGGKVWEAWQGGEIAGIRDYCETDVMNTWLVYCRFQRMRGGLAEAEYAAEIDLARQSLSALAPSEPHWAEYLAAWR